MFSVKGFEHGSYRFFRAVPVRFSGWMGTFLFLVFCQLALAAGAMAADPEKKAVASNGQLSKNVASGVE